MVFALPIAAGLLSLCWPESRKTLVDAVRYDAHRLKGRLRHPVLLARAEERLSPERPSDGWAP